MRIGQVLAVLGDSAAGMRAISERTCGLAMGRGRFRNEGPKERVWTGELRSFAGELG